MKIKSYFSQTVADAIALASQELGPEAMLVSSRKATPETAHLGEYEVVFAGGNPSPASGDPASPHQPANDRIALEMAELKKQLESMRHALTKSAFAPTQWLGPAPGLAEAYALLTANDVEPELARDIVQAAASACDVANKPNRQPRGVDGQWREAVAQEMRSRFRVEPFLGTGDARPRIVALVGPPGGGKTTALVKLAVNYGLAARRPMVLLSADTYRVAAADQLRSYAAILGVGCQVQETVSALAQAIEENRSKDLILIDTAGFGFADIDISSDLAGFLATRKDIDRQLVLSASMKSVDLARVIDAYEIFRPQRLLFTRLDETASLGLIFNEAARTRKALSFFSTGQRIPEDLATATQNHLVESILGSASAEALSA
jgi:flagellar biosynthesis protein FlhF